MAHTLNALQTAKALPWIDLVDEIALLLQDDSVNIPPRLVQPLGQGASLFVMPAVDSHTAITKLITFTPANAGTSRPTIQGDVVVFDVSTGERRLVLHGPTVTARRTAAVSALAAQRLAHDTLAPLLIVGAGVQGKAHLEAFAAVLGTRQVMIASRSVRSAEALAQHAKFLGLQAEVITNPDTALANCQLAVTCTPASSIVLHSLPRPDAFISAVGAFTPSMAELSPDLCRHIAEHGRIWLDTADAQHEAGDLLQAGLELQKMATLGDLVRENSVKPAGPVLFKSCGWAGWDLAAARLALRLA
jgi:1-piperideine-2-carboxylate/1-pyrroline-2-carboxylate reductase [NAD(P)H]